MFDGEISSGTLIPFIAFFYMLIPSIKKLTSGIFNIQKSNASSERIFEILDTYNPIEEVGNPLPLKKFDKEILFKEVSFSYEKRGAKVLKNINFSIPKGKTVALVGSSGSGKTTISNLLPRFYDASEGVVSIDGKDIREVKIKNLRGQLGIVSQESILFNDKLKAENLQNKQEQQIKDLEQQQLQEQVDFKNRELTSTAIHLLSKNEILNDINDKVTEMEGNSAIEQSKSIKRIKFLIKENLHLDNDWEVFKKHFTDVHPKFFTILLNNYPELTPDELKLCAYLKIQLSSKEIARLINITVIAVNKRRNRLRKKLNISAKIDLHEFLLNLKSE